MSNTTKLLFDNSKNKDTKKIVNKTDIQVFVEGTDELLFRGANKVLVSGSAYTASKHFNLKPNAFTPSYNTVLALDHTVNEPYEGDGIRPDELVYLFALGTDGCGDEARQVYEEQYTEWIRPESLVPFRVQLDSDDLSNSMRNKYFGRKAVDDKVLYYFKAFEGQPEFIQQYIDGTPIDESVYLSNRNDEVESYTEILLKVTKEDCRDYFMATTGINDARINAISLLTAWKKEIDGHIYYQDIRPFSRLNFSNESLIDLSKGIDIVYHIYY